MDIEQARFNMVEQQIRTWEVLDQDVLDLLFVVRREDFVPAAYKLLAFADLEIPLGDGEKMWAPKMEARVIQELKLTSGESVLEIGTGSGYLTALLASLGAMVTSVEINSRLSAEARAKLARAQLAELEKTLAKEDFLADFQFAMRGEKIMAIQSIEKQRVTREIKSVDILQPGPSLITHGLKQVQAIIQEWHATQIDKKTEVN